MTTGATGQVPLVGFSPTETPTSFAAARGRPCASKCQVCDFINWAGRSRCGAAASHGIGTRINFLWSLV